MNISSDDIIFRRAVIKLLDVENGNFEAARELLFLKNDIMKLPNGGNAQLDVGNNQEYILPFIGELRSLLNDNQAELEKVPDFREALEQFMFEMEEMSDYPWIELLWENEIKTRSNRVKFVFNYMNKSYCLIQYYYSNVLIGMERMNYVIEYIVNHRNDDTTQNE